MAAAMKVLDVLETTDALARMDANGRLLQEDERSGKRSGIAGSYQVHRLSLLVADQVSRCDGKDSLLVRSLFTQECVKRGVLLLATHNMTAAHDPLAIEQTTAGVCEVCKTLANGWAKRNRKSILPCSNQQEEPMPEAVIVATGRTPIGRASKARWSTCDPTTSPPSSFERCWPSCPNSTPRASRTSWWAADSRPASRDSTSHASPHCSRACQCARRDGESLLLVVTADHSHGRARDSRRRG